MKVLEIVNYYHFLVTLSERQFNGKLAYAIYKNMTMLEPIVKKYFEDIKALASAFKIEEKEGKYDFSGEAFKEFELILNESHEIALHKVDLSIIENNNFSVAEIKELEKMINVEK